VTKNTQLTSCRFKQTVYAYEDVLLYLLDEQLCDGITTLKPDAFATGVLNDYVDFSTIVTVDHTSEYICAELVGQFRPRPEQTN
jgi:hypothetical protein